MKYRERYATLLASWGSHLKFSTRFMLIVILQISLTSCNRKKIIGHFSDGKTISYEYYEDEKGKPNGPALEYYETGAIKQKKSYKHGDLDGLCELFFPNGQLFVQAEYNEGRLNNLVEYHDSAGRPLDTGEFRNGNGKIKVFDTRGFLIAIGNLRNGYLDGAYYLIARGEVYDSILYKMGISRYSKVPSTVYW